ncbi:MAG: hypothetical protein ACJ78Q_14555 [Chloroflexia bacterium]
MLSLPTQQLVRDLMPQDTGLLDLGESDLRDLIRPEHIYQLTAPDLPTAFPSRPSIHRQRPSRPPRSLHPTPPDRKRLRQVRKQRGYPPAAWNRRGATPIRVCAPSRKQTPRTSSAGKV